MFGKLGLEPSATGHRVLAPPDPRLIRPVSVRSHAVHTADAHWGGPAGQRTP